MIFYFFFLTGKLVYERILSMCVENRVSLPGNLVFVSTVLKKNMSKVT